MAEAEVIDFCLDAAHKVETKLKDHLSSILTNRVSGTTILSLRKVYIDHGRYIF